jgi:hypothetical protein
MKTLNELIKDYTAHLQQGDMQIAYKGIIDFIGKLRAEFIKRYPHYDISNIYQGYMDMSYFALSIKALKDKGLKIAIVYLHDKGSFEVWLSARNRQIAKSYTNSLNTKISGDSDLFHDDNNPDAVIEYILTTTPDFENQFLLIDVIHKGVEKFIAAINNYI